MILDTTIDSTISNVLTLINKEERKNHISSGKLSASMLGQPLQWQILKLIGVPQKELDEYTLRKFQRGKDVEHWLIDKMPGIKETQKFVEYKNCVGYVDALVDTKDYQFKCGVIPHEIKSVANFKFKRIEKAGEPDRSHLLQTTLYALALGTDNFAISYVASDDYRVKTWVFATNDYKGEVEQIIAEVGKTLSDGNLPPFTAIEKWQSDPKYQSYPDWAELDVFALDNKLSKEYKEQYNKLKGNHNEK